MIDNLISVIVPVYNCEKYLDRCINSILNQTHKNIEIILVNDGSTDNSGKICDEYSKSDNRISVIHKENQGVSEARNSGIKVALGEFLQFVDSDDYIESNMCELLINSIRDKQSDIVICGYKYKGNNFCKDVNYNEKFICSIDELKEDFPLLYKKALINSPWNKLYRKSKVTCYFRQDLSLGEDLLFNLSYLNNCNSVKIISECPYNYIIENMNSLTSKYRENLFDITFLIYDEVMKFCNINFGSYDKKDIDTILVSNIIGNFQLEIYYSKKSLVEIKEKIKSVLNDKRVNEASKMEKTSSSQYRIIQFLIRYKLTIGILLFFKIKYLISFLIKK